VKFVDRWTFSLCGMGALAIACYLLFFDQDGFFNDQGDEAFMCMLAATFFFILDFHGEDRVEK